MRIALVADSHLSPRTPECVRNWHAAARAVSGLAVDLTVHLGDITLSGQNHALEIDFAAKLFEDWPTPIRCVPGNHDNAARNPCRRNSCLATRARWAPIAG